MPCEFQTGDTLTVSPVTFTLICPDEIWFKRALYRALFSLGEADNWSTIQGAVSADDAAQAGSDLVNSIQVALPMATYPIGAIFPYAGKETPVALGALNCDGTTYNRVDYPALYAVLNTALIVNADTFTVPDLRGRFPLGVGQGDFSLYNRTFNSAGGIEDVTLTINQMPAHAHTQRVMSSSSGTFLGQVDVVDNTSGSPVSSQTTLNTGGGASHSNMPPYLPLLMYIQAL